MTVNLFKQNNRGLTLVELIVVISIISILTATAGVSIALAFSRDAERCAKTIDRELERARMDAMSQRGEFSLGLDPDSNSLTWRRERDGDTDNWAGEKLQNGVNIRIYRGMGDARQEITEAVWVTFEKASGKVESVVKQDSITEEPGELFQIEVTNQSGNRLAVVILVKNTGKHYVAYSLL